MTPESRTPLPALAAWLSEEVMGVSDDHVFVCRQILPGARRQQWEMQTCFIPRHDWEISSFCVLRPAALGAELNKYWLRPMNFHSLVDLMRKLHFAS